MTDRVLNGRYRILNKVGTGGMAEVYKGLDLETERIVAIKILKQEYSNDPQYLRRLSREAQAMVAITNEHVVKLYDMGSEDDAHYLVLEYVDGETLRDRMDREGALDPNEAVGIVADVLDGLAEAHKMGLVHRDVKPQNIMITKDGVIKLADFGIAKFTGSATKTYDGKEALGSVYYISPEQAQGEEVDAQADIYSTGIMLYEMLYGYPPFTGENAVQIALKHINDSITPLHDANSRISVALSDVVAKATVKDRTHRYSDAEQMKKDLLRALRNPLSRFAKLPKIAFESDGDTASTVKPGGFIKEHLPLIAIVGCVVGIIAVFVVMFLISMHGNADGYSKVPSFLGYTEEAAAEYAKNRGFEIVVSGHASSDEYNPGEICEQDPAAQSKAKPGTVVKVVISTGMETVHVPKLYGLTVEEAKKALEDVGLVLDKNIEYQTGTQEVGTVIGQSVDPDETMMEGDTVGITVCTEAVVETVKMPKLVGMDIESALDALERTGISNYRIQLNTRNDGKEEYEDFTVIDQNPADGMDIIYNTILVEMTVYTENEGAYKAEFSENVTLSDDSNDVVITAQTRYGEVVLFRNTFGSGTISIPFTGRLWESGSYTCTIYVNGTVYTSFTRSFE